MGERVTPKRSAGRDETRSQIMDRAATAMARDGYHGMSMRDLAKATRRGLASFYSFFHSKEDLLFELQREAFSDLVESAERAVAHASSPDGRLEAFVANHVRRFVERPDVMRVLIVEANALPPARRAVIRAQKQRYFDLGASVVREQAHARAPDALDVERATYCFFGMLNWVFGWYEPARHGPADALARSIVLVARHGVGAALSSGEIVAPARVAAGGRS